MSAAAVAGLEEMAAALARRDGVIAELRARLAKFEARNLELEATLEWYVRQIFGRKSEKLLEIDLALQGDLFAGLGVEVPPDDGDEDVEPPRRKRKKRRKKDRSGAKTDVGLRFDETVPVETIPVKNPETEGLADDAFEVIGEKEVHRLARRTSDFVVLRYVMPVVKRREDNAILTPPAPPNVLERSCVDVSFLAGMLVDKFDYHLPLYRQHRRLKANGITLSRASLTNWSRNAIELLRPIFEAQCASVLSSAVVAMDETGIRAGREKPGQMRSAYLWPIHGDRDEIVFHYAPDRGHRHVGEFLGDYKGCLLSDGYEGYASWAQARGDSVVHAECWSHTRREFERAQKSNPTGASEALLLIAGLYRHEKKIRENGLEGADKLQWRQRHSRLLVKALWRWCRKQRQRTDLLPKDPFTKALNYAWNRRAALEVFLSNPDLQIDTNHLERALRVIPTGRRNWLFAWTELGAEHVGIVQSLIVTCTMQGINPRIWLVDVLQRVQTHPHKKVEELTPRLWKTLFADNPMTSDIGTGTLDRADG